MKNEKMKIRLFTVMQWKKEQEFLRREHKNGWKFTRRGNFGCYHFEKCEPEDVVYQIDYNPEGIANKAEYVQMFSDCGWEYLQDYNCFCIFRKPVSKMNGDEEIFCDDASRLDLIKRVFRGRLLPCIFLFFGCVIPQLILQVRRGNTSLLGFYIVLAVIILILFLQFAIQYWKYKKSLK